MSRVLLILALIPLASCAAAAAAEPIELHTVPLKGVTSYRLLGMSMDDEGFIWVGSIHRVIHRYDPRTGAVETIQLPFDGNTSQCICVGRKVYLLGQTYPKLMIYHRDERRFSEIPYPSAPANVWYGTDPVDGRHLYLFDRGQEGQGGAGVIKWDTQTDTGKVIPWPYKTTMPTSGRFEARDGGLWCFVWDVSGGLPKYEPVGMARLDVKTDGFTGWYDFPKEDDGLKPYENADDVLFLPYTLKGKLVPFDLKQKRWGEFLDVPRFGERFGFIGMDQAHEGKLYFSLSTYDGDDVGCDGKPYHFCNGLLAFDPKTRTFDFPTLDMKDAYYQVAYTLSAGGHFFATGANIRQPDGSLQQQIPGDVVFWQTLKPENRKRD